MYCEKCGYKNNEDDQFCSGCGASLKEKEQALNIDDKKSDGPATASLVLGIISLVIPCIGFITAIVGLILGIISKSKSGIKKAGIIINIIVLAFCFILLIFWSVLPSIEKSINKEWDKITPKENIESNDKWKNIEPDEKGKSSNSSLDKKENGKVAVYLFRGEGCPHCQEAEEWFESIKLEYGNMFIIKDYEVWYNEKNAKYMEQVAKDRNENVNGVPYIIIGDKSWKGFTESYESDMLEKIKEVYNS